MWNIWKVGKNMKLKIVLKSILFTGIALLLVALSIIAFSSLNNVETINPEDIAKDYQIIDYNGICAEVVECFYNDGKKDYCLSCAKSDKIVLSWSDGSQTNMMEDLKSGKVSINSLIEHGLKVVDAPKTQTVND